MKKSIYLLLAGIVLSQVAAQAEIIRGTITNMDPVNNILRVRREGPSKNVYDDISVKVKADTVAKNVASLQELQVGHDVTIDAQANKATGSFDAKSIELVKV